MVPGFRAGPWPMIRLRGVGFSGRGSIGDLLASEFKNAECAPAAHEFCDGGCSDVFTY